MSTAVDFPFRPWVRSTSRRAMVWGVGVVAAVGAVAWWLERGETQAWGRAFGVLLAYSLLFWVSLFKIWWTGGRAAVAIDAEALYYQPLHTFRPRRIPFDRILACNPRPGTEALRVVVEKGGVARELFLNLAVVKGQHQFLDLLAERLEAAGLERVGERAWSRPDWEALTPVPSPASPSPSPGEGRHHPSPGSIPPSPREGDGEVVEGG